MTGCGSVVQGYGGAAARASCTSHALPFTGLNLTGLLFVGLIIIAVGVVLWASSHGKLS